MRRKRNMIEIVVPPLLVVAWLLAFAFGNQVKAEDQPIDGYLSTVIACMMQPPYECTAFTSSMEPVLLPSREACRERGNEMAVAFLTSGYWPGGLRVRTTVMCYPVLRGEPFPPGLNLPDHRGT